MSVKKNTYWNIVGAVIPILVGALSIVPLVDKLGVELFGVLTILWVVIGYFSLFDLGVGRALTQQVSKLRVQDKGYEIEAIIKAGIVITLFTGVIGASLIFFLSDWLAFSFLNLTKVYQSDVYESLIIALVGVPITTLSAGLRGVLEGFEEFAGCNVAKIFLGSSLFAFPLIGVLIYGGDIRIVALGLVLARIFGLIIFLFYMSKICKLVSILRSSIEPKNIKRLLTFGGWMSISNLISPLLVNIDRFFISNILGAGSVAIYTLPFEFIVRVLILPGAIGSTLLPRLAVEFNEKPLNAKLLVKNSVLIVFSMLVLFFISTILFASYVLNIVVSSDIAEESYIIAVILTLGVIFNGVSYIYYTALHSLAHVRFTAMVHVVEFILYIPFVYLMIKEYGVVGAAASWALRAFLDCCLMFAVYRKATLNV